LYWLEILVLVALALVAVQLIASALGAAERRHRADYVPGFDPLDVCDPDDRSFAQRVVRRAVALDTRDLIAELASLAYVPAGVRRGIALRAMASELHRRAVAGDALGHEVLETAAIEQTTPIEAAEQALARAEAH